MTKVSVIVPAFQAAAFIGTAVRSALDQSLTDIELLVVDDGSCDGTAEAARAAAPFDPRLRVIRIERNGGVSRARNRALDEARGTWIAPLDADDVFARDRLARLVAAAEAEQADLLADHVMLAGGSASELLYSVPERDIRKVMSAERFISLDDPMRPLGFMKPLMKRAFIEKNRLRYPDEINAGEDFHFYVRCLLHGARLSWLRDARYIATARPGSLSRSGTEDVFKAFGRSTGDLLEEARTLGASEASAALKRRETNIRPFERYIAFTDALQRRDAGGALQIFSGIALRAYPWRRFGAAARRRFERVPETLGAPIAGKATALRRRILPHGRSVRSASDQRVRRAVELSAGISLDVFGVAMLRCVPNSRDVFEITGLRLAAAGAVGEDSAAFADVRAAAEREVRQVASAEARAPRFEDIYAIVARALPGLDAARAAQEELAVVRAVSFPNPDVVRVYYSLAPWKRIVFIANACLPQPFVEELLRTSGFGRDHSVVQTNDAGNTGLVRLHADSASENERMLRHFSYAGPSVDRGSTAIADKVIDGIAALSDPANADAEALMLRDLGLSVMGPMFLGFSQWLLERIRENPSDLVLFCARDGYFLHRTFARFADYVELPRTGYFEVSRRALVFPTIERLDDRALDFLCANNAPLVLSEFFSRIGIDIDAYPDCLTGVGLRADARIYDADSRRRLRELFVLMSEPVLEQARSERELVLAYLRQSGACEARDLVLVDMGWGGTLQRAVADILAAENAGRPERSSMRAYYLSTDKRIRTLGPEAGPATAWFANAAEPEWMHEAISPGYWLLEIAFSANHGTVLEYRRTPDGGVEPVHHVYDANVPNARAARAIHAAADELLERWLNIFAGVGPSLEMSSAFDRFQRFVKQPTQLEARFFGDMVHIGGLGTTAETLPIAAPPALRDVVRQPRALLRGYRESLWQVAFLQRLIGNGEVAHGLIALRDAVGPLRKMIKGRANDNRRRTES